jgi:alpha-ketoglutarate-dependent taurine dioxygenase
MHTYIDRENPFNSGKQIPRKQPIVRTHPVSGWKSLCVNRHLTEYIEGLDPGESKAILEYLYDVYEKNLVIQVRFDLEIN